MLASLAACGREDNLTPDTDTDPVVEPPPDLPVLVVDAPARGAFLAGSVTVSGHVDAGTGTPNVLRLNDEDIDFLDGAAFSVDREPAPGLYLVGTRVEDDLGERAVDGRAVHVGPTRAPGEWIDDAMIVDIGRPLLDDDEPDVDDFATITERLVADPSFTSGLIGQTFGDSFELTLAGMSVGGAEVDIDPQQDVLWFDVVLLDLDTSFTTEIAYIDVTGWTSAEEATIFIDLVVEPGVDGVTAEATSVEVVLDGFDWGADYVPGWAEDSLEGTVQQMQEEALAEKISEMVPALLGDALSSFAFDLPVGSTTTVAASLSLADAEAHPGGITLRLDGRVTGQGALPAGAGSLRTDGAPPPFPTDGFDPITLAIDDDFLNQILFATWQSGALADVSLTGAELILMTGEDLPPPLGPVEEVTLDLGLPPVLTPSPDREDDQFTVDIAVGELVIDIERDDGEEVTVSLSVRAGTELAVADGGLAFELDRRSQRMDIVAGMLDWPDVLDPGDLASLFRLSAPGLVGGASSALPALPAPSVDLGAMTEVSSLNGVVWEIQEANAAMEESGWLVIRGRMGPR